VIRARDYLTYGELIDEDAAHLEVGGVIVSLPARDAGERERAERVFSRSRRLADALLGRMDVRGRHLTPA
jgi:hypothetical protein